MTIDRRFGLALAASLSLVAALAAEEISLAGGLAGTGDSEAYNHFFTTESLNFDYSNGPFQAFGGISVSGEGKYGDSAAFGYLEGASVSMEESGLRFRNQFILAEAGRLRPTDIVDSPYSLFVSDMPATSLGARYTLSGESVSMTSRWISLNERSELGYPDRGAVIKAYSLKLGKLTLAFQDAAVYTANSDKAKNNITDLRRSNFDAEYFINPLPGFFIQYLNSFGDQPRNMQQNDNSLMGLFAEWRDEGYSAYIQFLVDDINLNRFFAPSSFMIPDKIALSVGGTLDTELGRFGLYAGGATKYSFESIGGNDYDSQYGYTYVPDVSYSVDGDTRPILMEDNMVGFRLGENALGCKATWTKDFDALAVKAGLELTLKGEQSPSNSWHGADGAPDDTAFLDDPLLETKLTASAAASWSRGGLGLSLSGKAGYAWNPLALVPAPDAAAYPLPSIYGLPLLRPVAGGSPFFALTLGASYAFAALR